MSIPSTTWWPSRSIPPRSSITPATGCHGITRPASPSTILDEPALPNILNQTLTAVLQPGGLGNVYPSASSPADFFPLRRLAGNSRMWGFAKEEDRKCVDFIIGVNEDGEQVTNSSDPDRLANFFGANPEAPNYLTAVHFRKAVLDKYYQQASKYSVEDSYLRCGSLWGLQMDNHHSDKVCVWLGDLGRDLPYNEQLHWRSHNILPVGNVSETYFKRQILAEFNDSVRPEHNFSAYYSKLQHVCQEFLGWSLLLPLAKEDEHHLQSIRIPSTDEQKDFDDLILALTKILVDSLNEKELNRLIPKEEVDEVKGSISRLERVLELHNVERYKDHIEFLRNLQNLRSAGTAHRKGSNYLKIAQAFSIHNTSLAIVFEGILVKSNDFLKFLEENVCCGNLGAKSNCLERGGS